MDRVLSSWRRYRDAAMLVGPWRALALAPSWLVYREFLVVTQDLRTPLPEWTLPCGPTFRPLAIEELGRLEAVNPAMSPAEVKRRLAEGQTCLVGWLDGEPVFHHWFVTGKLPHLPVVGLRLALEPGDILGADLFTTPTLRARGIGRAGQVEAWRWARERGYRREIGFIAAWNVPSLRLSRAQGRRPVARVAWWQLGPWRRYVLHGAARLQDSKLTILPTDG
jgi:GNAT superfamily N-acetyltransferase